MAIERVNQSIFQGIAGRRPQEKPRYYILHNDAGSMNHRQYIAWLQQRYNRGESERGFAHYYIDRTGISRVEDTYNGSWSCADAEANRYSLGYEVCEQSSATDEEFLANEAMCLRQMAEDMTFYGDTPSVHNIKFHNEFSATSCPARSLALHGGTNEALRQYVIEQIRRYQAMGDTVEAMQAPDEPVAGWRKEANGWRYYDAQGQLLKSMWRLLSGAWYYFKADGYAVMDGWYQIAGKWYYFDTSCAMRTGWLKHENQWYFLGEDGHMYRQTLVERDGKLYYVQSDGTLLVDATISINANGEITKV